MKKDVVARQAWQPFTADDERTPGQAEGAAALTTAVATVHFLTGYFRRGNLIRFGIYCLLLGVAMVIDNA